MRRLDGTVNQLTAEMTAVVQPLRERLPDRYFFTMPVPAVA
jgi:hypothetical protein